MSIEQKRHSLAHLMAAAIVNIWPDAKPTIGPAVDNGFYYDFDFTTPISDKDFKRIENKMREMIKKWGAFEQKFISIAEAKEMFKDNPYKLELIDGIEKAGEKVSIYTSGDFADLCAGPHVADAKELSLDGFKINKLAGAYWRGDEKNKQLTRIYALAFESKEALETYEKMIVEAEKRDHRKLGKELDFFMNHDVAPGMPFFLPKGMIVMQELLKFVREYSYGEGYKEVRTPQLLNSDLWKISGHWEHYKEDMFCFHHAEDDIDMGLKPMNCPAHMLVFQRDIHSYRDLPLRIAETTVLHRNEKSGTLLGLTRVRSLSQDDTHIFARPEQILSEISELLNKIKTIYKIFNLEIDEIHLSTRPEKFLGEKAVWDEAESSLKKALSDASLNYKINDGDGAFYGPKIDVKVKDAIGRQWQLATIQLDFQLPLRFDLKYTDSDGTQKTPVVIHRALLGSMERFFGVIMEHYSGNFPTWLSPVQVKVIPVRENHNEFAKKISETLKEAGVRVDFDDRDEGMGKKIRAGKNERVPYMIVIGDKEIEENILTIESRGGNQPARPDDAGRSGGEKISLGDFVKKVSEEIKNRTN